MDVSRSLVIRFSQDMAELYTDLLGLGEAKDSGALFTTAQRLVESLKRDGRYDGGPDNGSGEPTEVSERPRNGFITVVDVTEVLALSVLTHLTALDRRGLLLRPGRRRRLFGITLSLLNAVRAQRGSPGHRLNVPRAQSGSALSNAEPTGSGSSLSPAAEHAEAG